MEVLVLFVILALLVLGARRGQAKRPIAVLLGVGLLLWLLVAFGLGALWNALTSA